jgi:hypothetical protein
MLIYIILFIVLGLTHEVWLPFVFSMIMLVASMVVTFLMFVLTFYVAFWFVTIPLTCIYFLS